jgi:hypothetical protein
VASPEGGAAREDGKHGTTKPGGIRERNDVVLRRGPIGEFGRGPLSQSGVELAVHQEREDYLPAHGIYGSVALGRLEQELAGALPGAPNLESMLLARALKIALQTRKRT